MGMGLKNELIDMERAINLLKTSRPTFYRWLRSGKIKGMKVGRQWRFYKDDIERFICGKSPEIEIKGDIESLFDFLAKSLKKVNVTDPSPTHIEKIDRAAFQIVLLAAGMGATDIHISSLIGDDNYTIQARLRFRIQGVLQIVTSLDQRLVKPLIEKWKIWANCNIHEENLPQNGRAIFEFDSTAGSLKGKKLDLRISIIPTNLGPSLTAQIINVQPASDRIKLDNLGFSPAHLALIRKAIHAPQGIVLTCGTNGTGKTTLLYAIANELSSPNMKFSTLENPVEILIPWATQTQISPQQGVSYETAFRAIMRTDPDVVLLSELEKQSIFNQILRATSAGCLILSSLTTKDTISALQMLLHWQAEQPNILVEAVRLIVSRRILRKLCPKCKKQVALNPEMRAKMKEIGLSPTSISKNQPFWQAVGCKQCLYGYKGEINIEEVLSMTPNIRHCILHQKSAEALRLAAQKDKFQSLLQQGIIKAKASETSLEEVYRVLAT